MRSVFSGSNCFCEVDEFKRISTVMILVSDAFYLIPHICIFVETEGRVPARWQELFPYIF